MKQTLSIVLCGISLFCGCRRHQVLSAHTFSGNNVPYIANTDPNTGQNLYTDEQAEKFQACIKPNSSYKAIEDVFNELHIDQTRTRLIGQSSLSFENRIYALSPSYRLSIVNPCGRASFSAKISKDEKPSQ